MDLGEHVPILNGPGDEPGAGAERVVLVSAHRAGFEEAQLSLHLGLFLVALGCCCS